MPSITITDADVAAAGAIRSDRTNPMVAGTYNLTIDEWVINETRRRSIDRFQLSNDSLKATIRYTTEISTDSEEE